MRVKRQCRNISKERYSQFKESNPNVDISFSMWKDILTEYYSLIRDFILETGQIVKLPYGFGELTIRKKKTIKFVEVNGVQKIALPIDWVKSKKAGKRIYIFNNHTEGYRYKWYWNPSTARFKMAQIWVFKPCRIASRKLASLLKEPNSNYQYIYKEW